MKSSFRIFLLLLLTLGLGSAAEAPGDALRVLIVADGTEDVAAGYVELLADHDVEAVVTDWEGASVEAARKYDLVMLTGLGTTLEEDEVVLGYETPVLGIGGYGGAYFGLLRLKHGNQHT